ncbi:unnamed protein product [Rhizophagus irregularis]|nr:unnamed protein product [Rhizophagus irregularis]
MIISDYDALLKSNLHTTYDVNKDAQNIQVLPTNSDSSSDNECIKETGITYFTKNLVFSIQGWKIILMHLMIYSIYW